MLLPVNVQVNTIIKDSTDMVTIEIALVERHRERESNTTLLNCGIAGND